MNHQPFREWLVSDEPLTTEQTQALQAHLGVCESCNHLDTSWKELEQIIHDSPQIEAPIGFSTRWQTNLAKYEAQQHKRVGWLSICLITLIAGVLLGVLIQQVWSLVETPGPFIILWLNRILILLSDYFVIENMIRADSWLRPGYIFIGFFFLVGIVSFMSVLWVTAYQKFTLARRIV